MRLVLSTLFIACADGHQPLQAAEPDSWLDAARRFTARSGAKQKLWVEAVENAPAAHRDGWLFLLENMPEEDLLNLSPSLVATHVTESYGALETAPWGKQIPKDVFLNNILPYASVNETRDDWRGRMKEISAPLIEGAMSPAEAASKLNAKLFSKLGVSYSTNRSKANQSALESISTHISSCTGLSILLVDACRSVGIPARLVGIPQWSNKKGNHSWVEIWDNGWHFTGAAEQDPAGLDRGWFTGDASLAEPGSREHSIYAASFRKTGISFPMDWSRSVDWVQAENVTLRYALPKTPGAVPQKQDKSEAIKTIQISP